MAGMGSIVRELRQARGWTQQELAERVGMSQRWVSDVESGRTRMPHLDKVRRLADVLGTDRGVLIAAADYAEHPDVARQVGGVRDPDPASEAIERIVPQMRQVRWNELRIKSVLSLLRHFQLADEAAQSQEEDQVPPVAAPLADALP